MLTGAQIRMARGFLRWSVDELMRKSGVSSAAIRRMEESDGVPRSIVDNLTAIQRVFEAEGVEFLPKGKGEAGVRPKRMGQP